MNNDRIAWQPFGVFTKGYDFGICLDIEFAREMASLKMPSDLQKDFVTRARKEVSIRMGYKYPEIYDFFEDSMLVKGFYLGNNGIWLTTELERGTRAGYENSIMYHSHNVDSSQDAWALLGLVDFWVEFSDVLKEKGIKRKEKIKF